MQLNHIRTRFTSRSVIGNMQVFDSTGALVFQCVTLEPPIDPTLTIKPRAIPEGTYGISIFFSAHLGCKVLLLANVPDFGDVEVHFGNWPKNTLGCILVGTTIDPNVPDQIDQSRIAFDKIMQIVEDAIAAGDTVSLTVGSTTDASA